MLSQVLKKNISTAYIVAGKRTAMGGFQSKLQQFRAPELGAFAIQGALNSLNMDPKLVDEVIMGTVCQANQGQNPARQASLGAGIPIDKPCTTINKVCSSGLKAVIYATQAIQLEQSHCVVAGGFESMSNVPFYVQAHRKGHLFGNQQLVDGLSYDGLTDVYQNIAMGLCAEKTAEDLNISRQLQDDYAILSYERAIQSIRENRYGGEITPVNLGQKFKDEVFQEDEEHKKFVKEKLPLIRPAFSKTGTITAGNSSKLNDAGCALILMSQHQVNTLNIQPLARIVSYADSEVEPIDFCIAPAKACELALRRGNMSLGQIDKIEINEAFAVTVLANLKLMDLDVEKVNVNGGAIAMGHPIGMSGARVLLSLITTLKQTNGHYGLASLCNGGGGSTAILIENLT